MILIYSDFCKIFTDSYRVTYDFAIANTSKPNSNRYPYPKKRPWFNIELRTIKEKNMYLKKNFIMSYQVTEELKKLKKEFRS